MLKFISGMTEAVAKTAIGLPVSVAADLLTLGGDLTDKKGNQSYTGDMVDSIGKSIEEASDDQ